MADLCIQQLEQLVKVQGIDHNVDYISFAHWWYRTFWTNKLLPHWWHLAARKMETKVQKVQRLLLLWPTGYSKHTKTQNAHILQETKSDSTWYRYQHNIHNYACAKGGYLYRCRSFGQGQGYKRVKLNVTYILVPPFCMFMVKYG